MTKPIITFTTEQAVAFITEKLQDDFSSNFDFIVSISTTISNNPETIAYNPWLVPDKEGWFTHDPEYSSTNCPGYIDENKLVIVKLRECKPDHPDDTKDYANSWNWESEGCGADIVKWKYA